MIAVELTAAIDAAGSQQTFYSADVAYCTSAADTPAHTPFEPRLLDPGSIGVHAFADGQTGGATMLEVGEIALANIDGALDAWLNYSFDGRPVVIRAGTPGAYPASLGTLLTCTADGIEADAEKLIVRLRDAQWRLDKPVCPNTYAGDNVLPNGLEGRAQDIKGQRKPRCYGTPPNVPAVCVNTAKLTYQVNDGAVADIPAVYDKGAAVTKGADYATSALMQAASPAAGTYITCFAEGLFRLGAAPAGQVTADVTQGAAAGNRTVAQVIKQIALDAGLGGGEISAADVAALDASNSAVVGIWLQDETTALAAMDQVAASIGAWFGFDRAGVLRMGQLLAPSGTPAATINDYDIQRLDRRTPNGTGIPAWRYTLRYARNYAVQSSDIAGTVTADRRAWLAAETRAEKAEDANVKAQWRLAREMAADGLLTSAADAAAEAARRLALYKVRRDLLDVTVPAAFVTDNALELMMAVRVVYPRFGCAAGRDFRLLGITLALKDAAATLTLWG